MSEPVNHWLVIKLLVQIFAERIRIASVDEIRVKVLVRVLKFRLDVRDLARLFYVFGEEPPVPAAVACLRRTERVFSFVRIRIWRKWQVEKHIVRQLWNLININLIFT